MPASVAARIFSRSFSESFASAARLPERTVLNGSRAIEFRLLLRQGADAVQAIHQLRNHRLLDPQRAVLVEGGDALRAAARTADWRHPWSPGQSSRWPVSRGRRSKRAGGLGASGDLNGHCGQQQGQPAAAKVHGGFRLLEDRVRLLESGRAPCCARKASPKVRVPLESVAHTDDREKNQRPGVRGARWGDRTIRLRVA